MRDGLVGVACAAVAIQVTGCCRATLRKRRRDATGGVAAANASRVVEVVLDGAAVADHDQLARAWCRYEACEGMGGCYLG